MKLEQRALFRTLPEQSRPASAALDAPEFERLFEAYYTRIFRYIRYRVHDGHTAEDLTSQVFEKVLAGYSGFHGDRSPFEVWLFAIARNCVRDYFRRQARKRWLPLDVLGERPSTDRSPEAMSIAREEEDSLRLALLRLNDKERHLIALKYGAGLRNVEIAGVLGIAENNVGIRLHRTMKKLKIELERMDQHE